MAAATLSHDPQWRPAVQAYDYLTALTYPQFAWEVLRRNPKYRVAVRWHGAVEILASPRSAARVGIA